jgi:flagellar motor switch protein FliN/FliY
LADPPAQVQSSLFEDFASMLAGIFETMAGARPAVQWEATAGPPPNANLCWRQPFSGIDGMVWVVAAEPDWTAAAGHVLRAAGIEESDAASLKSTYLEVVGQALSGLEQALSARLGREVVRTGGEETPAPPGEASWIAVHLTLGAAATTLGAGFESALLQALPGPTPQTGVMVEPEAPPIAVPESSKTFELLLDVELPISVSFGRAQLALKDVLKLTTGSVVELNRSVAEPVEVIVNNCVIARGEVVVVEGNFGVRIQQVISRQERLRTLN